VVVATEVGAIVGVAVVRTINATDERQAHSDANGWRTTDHA